jgi:transposase-like protein
MNYTLRDFQAQFPNERACLDYMFNTRWPDGGECECGKKDCFYPIEKRRSYSCAWCGFQVYPCAGTIFDHSSTPLTSWFFAIFLISTSRNGVAAKELERQLGVTYKTAWRMAHEIRKLMTDGSPKFTGEVEADETYVGGKRTGKRGRGAAGKTPVVGIVQRRGGVKAKVVEKVEAQTLIPFIRESVEAGASVSTDELGSYNHVAGFGFKHGVINHAEGKHVTGKGRIHTQTIDGFWSQLKRSIDGTHHHVSGKHLQKYVDEFAFRYSHRYAPYDLDASMFSLIAGRAGKQLCLKG